MNESNPNRPLPPSVKARKEEMLIGLQSELALFHLRRKRKRIIGGSLAVGAVVLLVGLVVLDFNAQESTAGPNDIAEKQVMQDQPLTETPSSYVTSVNNNQNVTEKYIVGNSKTRFVMETVDDEELLRMLAASGNPSFLGKVNGELRLIPDARPAPH